MEEGRLNHDTDKKLEALTRRKLREQFRRRRNNLFKSATSISSTCDADIYVLVLRHGKYFTFKTTDRSSWPPCLEEIVYMSITAVLTLSLIHQGP